MEIGEVLLLGAALLIFIDLMQLTRPRSSRAQPLGVSLSLIACGLVVASYMILAQAFLQNNFIYEEVYLYSSSSLPPLARLYASWAGSSGSWMFLTFLFALGYFLIRFGQGESETGRAFGVLDFLLLFFILVVLTDSPFRTLKVVPMDGRGLNPLLQTPWMAIHPPVVFIGYILVLFSFAFSFDHPKSERDWVTLTRVLTHLAWLFLSIGIAIGGLWAYEVLGWGGYWAWDPVETASLLPWLTLTAYFHLPTSAMRRPSSTRAFMIMISASMVILSMAVTRGGLAVSVHSFGSSPVGFALLGLIAVIVGYFSHYQRKASSPPFELNLDASSVYSSSLVFSFFSLILIAVVCLWGLLLPIAQGMFQGTSAGMGADFFNRWSYPFAILFIVSLIGCQLHNRLNPKRYTILVFSLVVIGFILVLLQVPTGNPLSNFALPALSASLGAVVYCGVESARKRLTVNLGRSLIHLGVVVALLGVLASSTLQGDMGVLMASPGSTLELESMSLSFGNFTVIQPFGHICVEEGCGAEAAGLEIPVKLERSGSNMEGSLVIYLYSIHGVLSKPLIFRTLIDDVYLVLYQTEPVYFALVHSIMGLPVTPPRFGVTIKTFPHVNLIWLGVGLMGAGITFPLLRNRRRS